MIANVVSGNKNLIGEHFTEKNASLFFEL